MYEKTKQRIIDYKSTFRSAHGKRVLLDLMKAFFVTSESFCADSHKTAFNEGARSVVLRIMRIVDMEEKKFREFLEENEDE